MRKYSLIRSELVSPGTKIEVLELCKDGESLFQSFISEIREDRKLFDQIAGAIGIIEKSANLIMLSKSKFRLIEGHALRCKVYEVKKEAIRVYLFHKEKSAGL